MIRHFYATDAIDSIVSELRRTGVVIIDRLETDEVIDQFNTDLRPEFDRQGHLFHGDFNGYKTLRVGAVTKFLECFLACSLMRLCWGSLKQLSLIHI